MSKQTLIIFGRDGTATEVKEIVDTYFADHYHSSEVRYFKAGQDDIFKAMLSKGSVSYIVAVADFKIRKECISFCENVGLQPVSIIHPAAIVFPSAVVENGCYVAANVTISSEAIIGAHCLINVNASIGHHARLSDNVVVLPGARISGNVAIGSRTMVGSNSFIFQGLNVGPDNLIDALTYVDKDLEAAKLTSSKRTKSFPRPGL